MSKLAGNLGRRGPVVAMELKGAKALEQALLDLPKRIGKAALKRALIAATEAVAEDARRRVPRRSGRLREGIAVTTRLSKRQRRALRGGPGAVYAFVGSAPSRRAHLTEFGTGPRQHKRSGQSKSGRQRSPGKPTGQAPAQPFLRPAWEANRDQVLSDFSDRLWLEIEKAAARIARKALREARAGR